MVRAAYLAMELTGWFVIVPLSFTSLLTGLRKRIEHNASLILSASDRCGQILAKPPRRGPP
jgi:hypothetical protein